jgi:predicted dehydrogenase
MSNAMGIAAPVGVAVLGLGRWGVHWLRNFAHHPAARVVAIADPAPANLDRAKQLLPDYAGYCTTDWQAAIAQPGVEAIVVVTPAITHFELITTALELGLHVLVEKPITVDSTEARIACELADRQELVLMVDHTYRFNPAIQRGQQAVRSGDLGDLRYAYGTRSHLGPVRQDVDVMWDLAIHDLVILNHWLGQSPIAVRAKGQGWLQPDRALSDTVWAELTYPNGFQASMHWAWANPDKQRRLGLVGSEGTLIFDELADQPLQLQQGTLVGDRFSPIHQQQKILTFPAAEPLGNACSHFLDCVQRRQASPIANGWQGMELVQMLEGLAQSIAQNGAPIALEYGRMPVLI